MSKQHKTSEAAKDSTPVYTTSPTAETTQPIVEFLGEPVDRPVCLRYGPGVSDEIPHDDGPSMTVFRPTRRCPKCGLVNVTSARRCRRCQRQLDEFDRGAASERLVNTMRTRRRLILVVIGLVVASVVGMGVAIKWRLDALERFRDESRAVDADVKTLLRGARADASTLVQAFDEREFASLLRDQGPYWSQRVRTCGELRSRVRELVPRGSEQARILLEIEQRLDEASLGSSQLARAAESSDVVVARAAAARLAGDGDSITPR